jgi:hypothetical protein
MDSRYFFQHHQKEWNGKQGIYVIEQPLFSDKLGKKIYKIGYARNSLATRIADYRTAYTLIPFKIHLIYEVPERVGGQRANFALLTESIILQTLTNMGKWSTEGEWYYDIDEIMNVISSVRANHIKDIKNAKNWKYYSTHISTNVVGVVNESEISSSLKNLIALTDTEKQERFGRGQAKVNYNKEKVVHRK